MPYALYISISSGTVWQNYETSCIFYSIELY